MKLWVINRNTGELRHHGTKGMRWGVRRYQNPDGSLTAMGKLRYGAGKVGEGIKKAAKSAGESIKAKRAANRETAKIEKIMKKPVRKLTAEELKIRTERIKKEKELKDLENSVNPTNISAGKEFITKFAKNALGDSVISIGKKLITNALEKRFKIDVDEFEGLAKEAKKIGYEKTIAEGRAAIKKANRPDEFEDLEREAKRWGYEKTIYEGKSKKRQYEKDSKGDPIEIEFEDDTSRSGTSRSNPDRTYNPSALLPPGTSKRGRKKKRRK